MSDAVFLVFGLAGIGLGLLGIVLSWFTEDEK